MTVVTISPGFRVTLPRQIRQALWLKPGQQLQAIQHDDRITLIPIRSAQAHRGSLRGLDTRVPRQ